MSETSYKQAGVDIEAGDQFVQGIKKDVHQTHNAHVLNQLGGFAGVFDIAHLCKDYDHPVLVQSIDGVGTKVMLANQCKQFDTLGEDLLSACMNDILVMGARAITMMDYVANDVLNIEHISAFVASLARACARFDVAIVGGETAEMPGTYQSGEIDIVGVITGVMEKDKAINGSGIAQGDVVLGLSSSGLHTNGYSLARHIIKNKNLNLSAPISQEQSLQEALLAPHINYASAVYPLLDAGLEIKGMAHITGGGLLENIPRILPSGLGVHLDQKAWPVLPIFDFLCDHGSLSFQEAYRTFNMGIGWIMIIDPSQLAQVESILKGLCDTTVYEIGAVVQNSEAVIIDNPYQGASYAR